MPQMISEKVLEVSLHILEMRKKQVALAKELVRAHEYQVATTEEYIRANVMGDKDAFTKLSQYVKDGAAPVRRYYEDPMPWNKAEERKTKSLVEKAREFIGNLVTKEDRDG